MSTSPRTVNGLIIERADDRLTLREPTLGRNTVMGVAMALAGLALVAVGLVGASGFGTVVAVIVGVALAALGTASLIGHLRGDGVVVVDLRSGSITQAGRTVAANDGARPQVVVAHRVRHRPDPNGISSTARSWWQVELALGDDRWGLQPVHRHRGDADRVAKAVHEHVGGQIGHRDATDGDDA